MPDKPTAEQLQMTEEEYEAADLVEARFTPGDFDSLFSFSSRYSELSHIKHGDVVYLPRREAFSSSNWEIVGEEDESRGGHGFPPLEATSDDEVTEAPEGTPEVELVAPPSGSLTPSVAPVQQGEGTVE